MVDYGTFYTYHGLEVGAVLPVSFYKSSSQNRLWVFSNAHMHNKTMHPISHPTALRQKQFVTHAIL